MDTRDKLGKYINSYSDYIPIILTKIKEGYNIKQIHRHIADAGFGGKISTFYEWFKNNIRGHTSKGARKQVLGTTTTTHQVWWYGLSPRRLALTTTGILWGMDKKTGKHSAEQELSLKVFEQSCLLQQMNKAYTSFHSLLQSKRTRLLHEWINTYENSSITNIKSFIRGIKQDLNAVENAIEYPWTNSTVEGN